MDYALSRRADALIDLALDEDLPASDITTEAVLDTGLSARATIMAKEELTLSGLAVAERVFRKVDDGLVWRLLAEDGRRVHAGEAVAAVSGRASSILAAERTALNFLQRLSGIATATARAVSRVEGCAVTILDTRKTLPGWRLLEKAAVRDGGGANHRFSLSDTVLIKDNHLALAGGVTAAIQRARSRLPLRTRIEVEASSLEQVGEALEAGADVILFDNTFPEEVARAVAMAGDRAVIEASGGIDEEKVHAMAETGVTLISMGSITHSARAVDLSLTLEPQG